MNRRRSVTLANRGRRAVALLVLAVAAVPPAHAALESVALELPGQAEPSIVADPGGGFVLTWIDRGEGGLAHLRFATLDDQGAVRRRGDIASGPDWFVNWADFPSLAILDNGDWVTFFLVRTDPGIPYAYAIRTTRSTDAGRTWSEPVLLHDDGTPTEHGFVSLLPDGGDRALAVWLDGRRTPKAQPGEAHGGHAVTTLRTAVLVRDGARIEERELDARTCDCCSTDALRADDGPLVVYRDRTDDEIRDILWLQRTREAWTAPATVHADGWRIGGCPVNGPALARIDTVPLAAWPTMVDGAYRVRVARRDGDTGWSAPIELDAGPGVLGRVDAAAWGEREALVSWLGADGDEAVLRVARVDTDLAVGERVDIVRLPPGRMTGMPRLASNGAAAVVVWTSPEVRGGKVRGVLLRETAPVATASPYAGWEERPIKALSAARIDALRRGAGAGYALAAELNGYPGPRHVLDLADALGLDAGIRVEIAAIEHAMQQEALQLGAQLIDAEAALDDAFAAGTIDRPALDRHTQAIAAIDARLRAAHLAAHLGTAALLDADQRRRYARLRGYDRGNAGRHQGHSGGP